VLAFEALPSNLMLLNLSLCLNTGFDDATRLQVKQVAVSDASECKVAASRDEASRGILLCSKVRPWPPPPLLRLLLGPSLVQQSSTRLG
jgi:hypothetical protein